MYMITLPIEIGDTVLGGRFRNRKIVVKEIGTDPHGQPTINGKTILKIRIPKLMNIASRIASEILAQQKSLSSSR